MTVPVFPDYAGRLHRLQVWMEAQPLEALVISSTLNIRYLSGFSGSAGLLLVTPREARLLVDGRYETAAREGLSAGEISASAVERVEQRYDLTLGQAVARLGLRRVGFEAAGVTVATLGGWQRAADGIEWVPTESAVEDLRLIKDAAETEVFRRAGRALAGVAHRLPDLVARDRTERQIARAIDDALLDAGFSEPAFPTIVASGPNSARPHARPTDRMLTPGDLVVLDFGGVLDGYCVDLTRMAAVAPVGAPAERLYAAVRDAHDAALAAIRPGVEASAVDRAARGSLEAAGLGSAFVHGTGHGLGLEVHEAPRVGPAREPRDETPPTVVREGMVFTVEPGAYVPEIGGARLEDDVLVTAEGGEVLTNAARGLLVV